MSGFSFMLRARNAKGKGHYILIKSRKNNKIYDKGVDTFIISLYNTNINCSILLYDRERKQNEKGY